MFRSKSKKYDNDYDELNNNDKFRIQVTEIKPIDAKTINFTYPFENDQSTKVDNDSTENKKDSVEQLQQLVDELKQKNKEWESKYDDLNKQYDDLNQKSKEDSQEKNTSEDLDDDQDDLDSNNKDNKKEDDNTSKSEKSSSKQPTKKELKETAKKAKEVNNEEKYKQELEKQIEINKQLEQQVSNLSLQIETERKKMVDKLQEKAQEAQKLVNEKLAKLDADKLAEIKNNKMKIYESTINAFLDPYVIFKKTLESVTDPSVSNYLKGFEMISNMIFNNLTDLGLKEINIKVGDQFDENFMVAFDVCEDDNFEANQVVKIVNPGFILKLDDQERVIKYASVIVAKKTN